jgi:hypothetical protein
MSMPKVKIRECDAGSAFAVALQRNSDLGAGRCDDAAVMAGFLDSCAQILLGPRVSARLLWDGAQRVGLTSREMCRLMDNAPDIAMELMWVETNKPLPAGLTEQIRSHLPK